MPNDDHGQDHMFRFIPLKEVDKSATFGEVARCDHQVVDRQKHACSFFAQLASLVDLTKCHRDLQASVLTSIRKWHFECRYQFFTQNCEFSELVPIMFRNSARFLN